MSEEAAYPKLSTPGFDARFPNTNQCVNARGEEYAPCQQFKKTFTSLCPVNWVEKWDTQRENGVFPALVEKKEAHH
ncbi:Cytochrome c oxidase subunit 6B [Boothiomyces macroporosus]|uniref:Cytochrome c oxidase subunit 6B n=1 Tax=Boothiomyces macroporosus TaxID=261099 RepID=A0AAD5Y3T6_9FUNG|nr:Cytochrome c oxidase subunit 6B [Boothiomyces macroporosus]